jgi:hypothetical protein
VNIKKSLETLKADLVRKETILRSIQNHHPHLAKFSEEELLAYYHLTTIEELQEHIQDPIKTSPEDEINQSSLCSCKNSKGEFKDLYDTQELAQQQADQLMSHQILSLRVYPCPYGYGWHLTKG